jgi:hypothetical protein
MGNFKNIAGQMFGRLSAVKPIGVTVKGSTLWECVCSCGNTATVQGELLRSGNTRSCGCLRKQHAAKLHVGRDPNCHPERSNHARGLCLECYNALESTKDQKSKNAALYRRRHPEKQLWTRARVRAEKRGLPFTITIEDVHIPAVCPVLGIPLEQGSKDGMRLSTPRDGSPSLDRVDPKLGYVPENVVVISYRANSIKSFGTAEEHEKIANWMRGRGPKVGT